MNGEAVAVFIEPFSFHFERDRLFTGNPNIGASDNALAPYIHLRKTLNDEGIALHTGDLIAPSHGLRRERNLYMSFGIRDRYHAVAEEPDAHLSAFFAFECPIVEPAMYRALGDAARYFERIYSFSTKEGLAPFVDEPVFLHQFQLPQYFNDIHESVWSRRERKFLVMINANKLPSLYLNELYTQRLSAVEFFNRYDEIDLYGHGWDGPPFQLGASRLPAKVRHAAYLARRARHRIAPPRDAISVAVRSAFRGPAASKAETLGDYTFALCFENAILEGWITEKIFDCFFAGTVPVYWGAPDIENWIPKSCFIDMRGLGSYDELRARLHGLSADEIEGYRIAARDFLRSPSFRPFSMETFSARIKAIVVEDAGKS